MLSEQVSRFLEDEDFKRLSAELDIVMSGDYFYSKNKTEILQIIAELVETAYKKGRADEHYHSDGPVFTLYDKQR